MLASLHRLIESALELDHTLSLDDRETILACCRNPGAFRERQRNHQNAFFGYPRSCRCSPPAGQPSGDFARWGSPVGIPQRLPQIPAERNPGFDGGGGGSMQEGLKRRGLAMETIILIVIVLWLFDII